MPAAVHLGSLDRSIAKAGDIVVLQHLSIDGDGTTSIALSAVCPAFVRAAAPTDLTEGRDTRIVLSATALATFGVPQRDDRVLIEGNPASIVEVEPIYRGGELVRVNLLCRG